MNEHNMFRSKSIWQEVGVFTIASTILTFVSIVISVLISMNPTIFQWFTKVQSENILKFAFPICALALFILCVVYILKIKKLRKLNKELITFISEGLMITYNKAKIIIDGESKQYKFSYTKRFIVFSDDYPKGFGSQFYCNKKLESNKEVRQTYQDPEKPKWRDICFFAYLKYKKHDDKDFSKPIDLKIEPILEEGIYMPFYIRFAQKIGNEIVNIPLEKMTEIELKYGYVVNCEYWGSYLNRTLSYFAEKAIVKLEHKKCDSKKDLKLTLVELKKSGTPEIIQEYPPNIFEGDKQIYEFILPNKKFGRYRIHWDSEAILNIPTTPIKPDDATFTNY